MKVLSLVALVAATSLGQTDPAAAQTYPIDCAILLCLAGGWPASVPCARARAEFIRRITPWPIEPPLQIWNCPMHTAWRPNSRREIPRVFDADYSASAHSTDPQLTLSLFARRLRPEPSASYLTQVQSGQPLSPTGQADIDISGHEFDFVRSIRVWHVRYSAWLTGSSKNCTITSATDLGSYGIQGDFAWRRIALRAAPQWIQPNVSCLQPGTFRAVGVEWQDYLGQSGHELVVY